MGSVQPGTSGVTGPVTRKRRQLEEEEEKRRAKEEMAKKVRKHTKTSFIEVDMSTGKIKTEIKEEPEEEQIVVFVKEEEVQVPMDNAGGGGEEDLGGTPVGFQESAGAELILKEFPTATEGRDVLGVAHSTQLDLGDVYPDSQQSSRTSVGVGTDLLASHYVPLEEFNKLKEEMQREKEESDKRYRALEADFQALQRQLDVNSTSTPKGDQPEVDTVAMVQEEELESAKMDTEMFNSSSDADLGQEGVDKNAVEVAAIEVPGVVLPASLSSRNSEEPQDDRTLTLFPEVDGEGREFQYDPNFGTILDSPVQPTNLTIADVPDSFETSRDERAKSQKNIEECLNMFPNLKNTDANGLGNENGNALQLSDLMETPVPSSNILVGNPVPVIQDGFVTSDTGNNTPPVNYSVDIIQLCTPNFQADILGILNLEDTVSANFKKEDRDNLVCYVNAIKLEVQKLLAEQNMLDENFGILAEKISNQTFWKNIIKKFRPKAPEDKVKKASGAVHRLSTRNATMSLTMQVLKILGIPEGFREICLDTLEKFAHESVEKRRHSAPDYYTLQHSGLRCKRGPYEHTKEYKNGKLA